MKILIIILLLSTPLCAEWTTQDTVFQTIFTGTMAIDCWQTYKFLYIDHDGSEKNPIIGKYPSKQKLFTLWGIALFSHTFISYSLPKPYRTFWQFFWIGVETNAIHHNYSCGTKINF